MNIKPIRTKEDHKQALAEIFALLDAAPDTPESDALEVLVTLVDAYERKQTPIVPPTPIEAIKFRLEQSGKTRKDLEDILGATRARVSEVLNGQRSLSLAMIRALHAALGIPLDVLVQESEAKAARQRSSVKVARGSVSVSSLSFPKRNVNVRVRKAGTAVEAPRTQRRA